MTELPTWAGSMLAAMLDYPFASLVNAIQVLDGGKLKISREIEGGNKEISEIDLPCVLSVQTGINEPRYVGMRGIRPGCPPSRDSLWSLRRSARPRPARAASVRQSGASIISYPPAGGAGREMLHRHARGLLAALVLEQMAAKKGGLN